MELKDILKNSIDEGTFIQGVLSNPRLKGDDQIKKVNIKPVMIKDEMKIQLEFEYRNKVQHSNLNLDEGIENILKLQEEDFRQGVYFTVDNDFQVLVSKKGKSKVLKQKPSKEKVDIAHNRTKNYIISEGEKVDFLIRLGVMNEDGRVVKKRYDKFKQINRFLELVEDIIPNLNSEKRINIVDFGCGKSYLTFAMYYYLVEKLNYNVNIIGLDLKKDVIDFCNQVAEDLNYEDLKFIHGDISQYTDSKNIDMIVTLHACDNATDAALIKAINWDVDVILSVPCCQHELYGKIENPVMNPMLKHGIIKEKLSSLVTDSIRGSVLEIMGYDVQLLEFIDMEHTPKNILIRGVKNKKRDIKSSVVEYESFKNIWNLKELYLEKNLGDSLKQAISKYK